jgi:hypothetical protein
VNFSGEPYRISPGEDVLESSSPLTPDRIIDVNNAAWLCAQRATTT